MANNTTPFTRAFCARVRAAREASGRTRAEMAAILEHLGFNLARVVGNSDLVAVEAPSWRPDIEGKADLVEEILRIAGLDRALAYIRSHAGVWFATGEEIVRHWLQSGATF